MRIVGATEHAVVLYRDKLPKFNNGSRQIGEDGKPIKVQAKMILIGLSGRKTEKKISQKSIQPKKPVRY